MMLCAGKPICGNKSFVDGNGSEDEDMYGFLPKPGSAMRARKSLKPARRVTFLDQLEDRTGTPEVPPPMMPLYPLSRRASFMEKPLSEVVHRSVQQLRRSASFVQYSKSALSSQSGQSGSGCCHHRRRPWTVPSEPPPYHIAVRRAASFSATRGSARVPRHPMENRHPIHPWESDSKSSPLSCRPANKVSSSTSELYVDMTKRCLSSMSVASTASSVSEATVYRKIGPGDYVSVGDKETIRSFRSSADENFGVRMEPLANVEGKDIENVDRARIDAAGLNSPRTDTYRFSMATLEDTQDVDLDAILGELSALESQYQNVVASSPRNSSTGSDISSCYRRATSNSSTQSGAVARTESPDNDSAFSDSVSLFSSESSTSSSTNPSIQAGRTEDSKTEKIKLALLKMKEANVKKLFVKVFDVDGGAKSLLVDESMKCGYVTRLLADKHHMRPSPRWALVEHLPELYMERMYEEHEPLVENLMLWTRDSKNKLFFVEKSERLLMFQRPEIFHPDCSSIPTLCDELTQNSLIEEYFANGGAPTVEGPLYIKLDSKKGWKKYQAVLRASGLYYYKEKTLKSSKELACLATFDANQVYYGIGWKKKFKAPTEHCFAIKHPCLQQPKSTKFIKYLCAEDALSLQKWVTAIRMMKYGRQLLENYQCALAANEDCESDSGSSGCCDVAFEADYPPCGTIKRKPPKLPLTATTRQLTGTLERAPSFSSLPPPPPELLASTLTLNEEPLPPPPPPPRHLPPPTETFLLDLQRVMRRKWQVAQKCKMDTTTTPHEVLGFRDPPPPDYKETNVSNWVAEHYGYAQQNLYENVHRPAGTQPIPVKVPVPTTPIKKKPPPPPPPRSETTQLTTINRISK